MLTHMLKESAGDDAGRSDPQGNTKATPLRMRDLSVPVLAFSKFNYRLADCLQSRAISYATIDYDDFCSCWSSLFGKKQSKENTPFRVGKFLLGAA